MSNSTRSSRPLRDRNCRIMIILRNLFRSNLEVAGLGLGSLVAGACHSSPLTIKLPKGAAWNDPDELT